MNSLGEWMTEHPTATRGFALVVVLFGTVSYVRMLREFVRLDDLLREHAYDTARAASESLGG